MVKKNAPLFAQKSTPLVRHRKKNKSKHVDPHMGEHKTKATHAIVLFVDTLMAQT